MLDEKRKTICKQLKIAAEDEIIKVKVNGRVLIISSRLGGKLSEFLFLNFSHRKIIIHMVYRFGCFAIVQRTLPVLNRLSSVFLSFKAGAEFTSGGIAKGDLHKIKLPRGQCVGGVSMSN